MIESSTQPSLCVDLAGLRMKNPVMVASGTFGYGPEYADLVDLNGLGAIVVKGIHMEPTTGNPTPRMFETSSGLLNAIGLPNPGVEGFVEKYMPFLRQHDVPLIINIWGRTVEEYQAVAARFDDVEGVHGLEVNVSCPNIKEGSCLFGTNLDLFREVVAAVCASTTLPVIPKLAPNVVSIQEFARAAEEEGADAISLINSVPGMAIDVERRRFELANITGGLTGAAIKPIAVKLVWEAAQAVQIPIVGIGGIRCAEDALEFILAGASCVAIGTANFTHPDTASKTVQGIEEYMCRHGVSDIQELVGSLQR